LEAYTGLLHAAHDFNDLVYQATKVINESSFDEKWQEIVEAGIRLNRSATLVFIAGPKTIVDEALRPLIRDTSEVTYLEDRDACIAVIRDWNGAKLGQTWRASASRFEDTARRILKTAG
jgi:hypothetical protein